MRCDVTVWPPSRCSSMMRSSTRGDNRSYHTPSKMGQEGVNRCATRSGDGGQDQAGRVRRAGPTRFNDSPGVLLTDAIV
jgi:hypothetical protein